MLLAVVDSLLLHRLLLADSLQGVEETIEIVRIGETGTGTDWMVCSPSHGRNSFACHACWSQVAADPVELSPPSTTITTAPQAHIQ